MYRPLHNFIEKEEGKVPFSLKGVLGGKVKAFFDGEQLVINEKEYLLKRQIFR